MNKLSFASSLYPTKLKALSDAPRQIYYSGDIDILAQPTVAIVGSRKSTSYGQSVTEKLARELASRGITIISGLAFGVDSFAHSAALSVNGATVAVLPGGLDNIYPRSHHLLAKQIVARHGCLVSEYPPKTTAFKYNFIARNRIIAALSDAIIITEAAAKSGSIHTANFGLELGKEIFAVPGAINSPNSEGCNNLLKAGARLVTCSDDITNVLGIASAGCREIVADNQQQQIILDLIIGGIYDNDTLQQHSGLDPELFGQTMTILEITNRIAPLGGNKWNLK